MLCMALSVVLSSQAAFAVAHEVEHAHHHAHAPNDLAGTVETCAGDHHLDCDHDGDHAPGGASSHHHGETALLFLAVELFLPAPNADAPSLCAALRSMHNGVSPGGLERPPKSGLETRV